MAWSCFITVLLYVHKLNHCNNHSNHHKYFSTTVVESSLSMTLSLSTPLSSFLLLQMLLLFLLCFSINHNHNPHSKLIHCSNLFSSIIMINQFCSPIDRLEHHSLHGIFDVDYVVFYDLVSPYCSHSSDCHSSDCYFFAYCL